MTLPETFDDMLREGIAALRAGDRAQAMSLLARAVRLDPHSEQAWLYLAGAVSDPAQRRTCLERVVSLNPQNQAALQGLRSLSAAPAPQVAQPAPVVRPAPPSAPPRLEPPPPPQEAADRVRSLLAASPPAPPVALPLAPELEPPPATATTVRLPPAFEPLPLTPSARPRRRPADLLVWGLILALGLALMFGSAIYAIMLVRGA